MPRAGGARGEIEYYEGQLAGAEADVKKSLELSTDAWPGPNLLSRIYLMQGRPQDALPEIERVRIDGLRAYLYAGASGSQHNSAKVAARHKARPRASRHLRPPYWMPFIVSSSPIEIAR
jgi:hypothetical protein